MRVLFSITGDPLLSANRQKTSSVLIPAAPSPLVVTTVCSAGNGTSPSSLHVSVPAAPLCWPSRESNSSKQKNITWSKCRRKLANTLYIRVHKLNGEHATCSKSRRKVSGERAMCSRRRRMVANTLRVHDVEERWRKRFVFTASKNVMMMKTLRVHSVEESQHA